MNKELFNEDIGTREDCELCRESRLEVGKKTGYGVIIYRIGNVKNGWFATLSPKTGGDPKMDFTVQLMPFLHLTHFSQIQSYPGLEENNGICFSRVCRAATTIMMEDQNLVANAKEKSLAASIATYGKCTTWREKKEHLHIKIFPFRGVVGQPYTVDSSYGRKETFRGGNEEFVKMKPVIKVKIEKERFDNLTNRFISLLK